MLWADTSTNLLKLRNGANSAWITVGDLTAANLGLAALASPTFTGTVTIPTATISTGVGIPLGSAASPTIYFTGDTNTGIYSPGADQFAITTGGSGRVFVDSSGRVGLGTSSPSAALHVVTSGAGQIRYFDGTVTGAFGSFGSGNEVFIGSGKALAFTTNGITSSETRMTIDTSGRVGIGTTSPSTELHVSASSGYAELRLAGASGSGGSVEFFNSTTQLGDIFIDASNNMIFRNASEAFRVDSSRRLLVGTSSSAGAGSTLQVRNDASAAAVDIYRSAATTGTSIFGINKSRGTAASPLIVAVDDVMGYIAFRGHDGTAYLDGAYIHAAVDGTPGTNDLPSRLVFSTTADGASSPTERARITAGGWFKATSSGDYYGLTGTYHESRTNAVGNVTHLFSHTGTSGNSYGIQISYSQNRGTQAGDQYIYCNDSAALRMEVRGNGGIANYSANNVNLSDRNAKKDIVLAAGTWDCLKEWEIVNFRYKDQPDDADLNMGVIAQQVAESCPEVITVFQEAKEATETKPAQEERLGVKDQQMMWMAIKALQEAQLRIETLEAEVAALKGA
jgi:hypothetical protein